MNFNFKKDVAPHLIAVVGLCIVIMAFFSPTLSGKKMVQGDIISHTGASKEISNFREKYGKEPLWTNAQFGGSPSFMLSTLYYGQKFVEIIDVIKSAFPEHANLIIIGAVSFYILLIIMGCPPIVAALGGIAFSLSTYTMVSLEAGHNSKVLTINLAPLLLGSIILVLKKRYWLGMALTGASASFFIDAGHYQIMYYFLLGLVPFYIYHAYQLIKEKDFSHLIKTALIIGFAAILGVGANAGRLMANFSYLPNSTRGIKELKDDKEGSKPDAAMDYDYAFSWSNGILETATVIIPYFYGGSSTEKVGKKSAVYKELRTKTGNIEQANQIAEGAPLYWGDQPFTSGPIYFGATVFFIFILAFMAWNDKIKWLYLSIIIFITMISWGKNLASLNYFLFDHFPGMNKFRSVSMAASVSQLFFVLLSCMGLWHFYNSESKDKQKILFKSLGVSLGTILLLFMIGMSQSFTGSVDAQLGQWPQWLKDALIEDRKSFLKADVMRSLFFMAAVGGAVYLGMSKKVTLNASLGAVLGLTLLDLWVVNKRYIYEDKFQKQVEKNYFQATAADQFILQDDSQKRVFNISSNTFNESKTSYYHHCIGGYSPTKMQRYQDLIENMLLMEKQILINALQQTQNPEVLSAQIFPRLKATNFLNGKYIIYNPNQKPLVNTSALGNAWFVKSITKVENANEEMAAIKKGEWNPAENAVVDVSKFDIKKDRFDGEGTIVLKQYQPNHLIYEVSATNDAFAVFSENYYPEGWNVSIDGQPATHLRANYILRGMEIPKGKHTVEFKFEPKVYYTGNSIALVSSIILFALVGFAAFTEIKKKPDNIA